jgi:hypothetical protein
MTNRAIVVGLDESSSSRAAREWAAKHAAERAALSVVGTREHVGLGRLLSGSVSHYCLSHALCPIVAAPAPSPLAGSSARSRTTTAPSSIANPFGLMPETAVGQVFIRSHFGSGRHE